MMRSSDGNWVSAVILRCSPGVNAISTEIIGTTITGASSGATAVVSNSLNTAEAGEAIVEFELNPDSIVGTFTDGERVTANSIARDVWHEPQHGCVTHRSLLPKNNSVM